MKLKISLAALVLFLGMGAMAYAWGRLSETEQVYREGNAAYVELSEIVRGRAAYAPDRQTVRGVRPSGFEDNNLYIGDNPLGAGEKYSEIDGAVSGTGGQPAEKIIYTPEYDKQSTYLNADIRCPVINFDALKSVNGDAAAWLYCRDTLIDYPVMKADDYNYYLHHLPDGRENANGALFIDYNCAPDFSGPLTVIYGHHMKSGSMFGSLTRYKEQSYFDLHPAMYLYTENGDYIIDLMYGCVIGSEQWRERAFMYAENIGSLLAYAARNTTFYSGAEYSEDDRIIAMSTCSYEFEDARYVVIGVLREME